MRLFVWIMICCSVIFLYPTVGQTKEEINISAQNAILIEASTGRVLYEKEAHEQKPIASITKVMTALVAIRYGDLSDTVVVSKRAAHTAESSVYLEENEKISLEDLLYGLLLRSGNDASVAIAEHIGGSEEGFVYLMNETAAYIGMTNTHFTNPHGLNDSAHYSSAYDMALLMAQANKNDIFREISGATSYQAKAREYPWHNKNKLLTKIYKPTTGGKTGFTKSSGRTLVTSAEKENLSLVAVTLNAPDDWNDQMTMYEWGFEHFSIKRLDKAGKQTFQMDGNSFTGFTTEEIIYPLQDNEQQALRKEIFLEKNPTQENQPIGTIRYVLDADIIKEIPVYQKRQAEERINWVEVMLHILQVRTNG